jgi:hypothetical protein
MPASCGVPDPFGVAATSENAAGFARVGTGALARPGAASSAAPLGGRSILSKPQGMGHPKPELLLLKLLGTRFKQQADDHLWAVKSFTVVRHASTTFNFTVISCEVEKPAFARPAADSSIRSPGMTTITLSLYPARLNRKFATQLTKTKDRRIMGQ